MLRVRILPSVFFSQGIFLLYGWLGDNKDQVHKRDKRSSHSSWEESSWPLSLFLLGGFSGKDDQRNGLGKRGWAQLLALLFSRHSERREAAVAVGRICHHCRVPSPAAFLLPSVELCLERAIAALGSY